MARGGVSESISQGTQASQGWYADREFNLQLFGAYAFTGNSYHEDRYLNTDHAWGGGLAVKYFFNRYLGVGLEGSLLSATQTETYINSFAGIVTHPTIREEHLVGTGMATVTLRYPIGTSRFAPYVFGGVGAIAGGGQQLTFETVNLVGLPPGTNPIRTYLSEDEIEFIGQFGGGIEFRVTPDVGWTNEFTWSVVDRHDSDFGMVRSGINFAF